MDLKKKLKMTNRFDHSSHWVQWPVSVTILGPQFKFDGNFVSLQFRCWTSDRNIFCTCHDSVAVLPCTKSVAITLLESR